MATEEYKLLTEDLLDKYLELRTLMRDAGHSNINFSFKDYLDVYLKYCETDFDNDTNDVYDDEDLEDLDLDTDDDELEQPSKD